MFKNLLRIPDTFDPEEYRRRQVLNILLMFCIALALIGNLRTATLILSQSMDSQISPIPEILILGFMCILWLINRSAHVSSLFSGITFIILTIVVFTQVDTPAELYNGRSTLIWAIPIMLGAILFPPGYSFLITTIICILMLFLTPPDIRYPTNSINYYSMLGLFFIAFIAWLGMSIANRAVRDARHHASEARNHAANLQAILNSIADGVLVLDLQGNFVSANPALLQMIPEKNLHEINLSQLKETLKWKQKVFSVAASSVPEVGSVVVLRDETRRYEIERAKDALLATASHELRTPLAAVMNYLELMLMLIDYDKIDIVKFKSHLTRACENTERLERLINNILDQAQIQAGLLILKPQRFSLPALIEKNIQMLDVLLKEKNLTSSLNITTDAPSEINADPERLSQVLVNLLSNAIKFTQKGGIQVDVSSNQPEQIAIAITDSGLGIPQERLPDIFEAFRRSSDYAQREQQGAGLGLSIAKEIITRMGGQISVTSTPGIGSTFTVSLPLQAVEL